MKRSCERWNPPISLQQRTTGGVVWPIAHFAAGHPGSGDNLQQSGFFFFLLFTLPDSLLNFTVFTLILVFRFLYLVLSTAEHERSSCAFNCAEG